MTGSGITLAGNLVVDVVKTIHRFPKPGMLTDITSVEKAVGGCIPNTGITLAKIDPTVPLYGLGRVGKDEYGKYLLEETAAYGIDISGVLETDGVPTSFSDVMNDTVNNERTIFHAKGANALFAPEDVDVDNLHDGIFHFAYILLMDAMDAKDSVYGTKLAGLLAKVQEKGLRTSIDVVSSTTELFREKVIPALKYTDYAIMNEIEGCGVSGLEARHPDGSLHEENIRRSMENMLALGVRDRVILHSPEAGFMLLKNGMFFRQEAMKIAPEKIAGKVGAGDSFCAGCLYALYTGMPDNELLAFAAAAAACNLTCADSVSGIRPAAEIRKIASAGCL